MADHDDFQSPWTNDLSRRGALKLLLGFGATLTMGRIPDGFATQFS